MAIRSWLKLLAATTTAAAVVGAGQLGIAYGLGMVRLDQTLEITQRDQWTAQLAWVAWITMTAAALGAVVATGLRPRWSPRPVGTGGALAMGVAAGMGALAVLPLTMQPARAAQVTGVQPVLVIGICAVLGAAVGIFAAYAAASRTVARWSLSTLSVIVWAIALISVAPSLKPGSTPAAVRLGVLEGSLIPAAVTEHTPFVTMPVIALLTGLILGWIARGRQMPTLTVALSGLAGPALLTMAYLIAGPGSTTGFGLSPYWAAMTASGAGVLGSVLATILRGSPGRKPRAEPDVPADDPQDVKPEPTPEPTPETEPAPKPETASGRATLPRRDVPTQSAIAQAAAVAAQRPDDQLRPSDTGIFTLEDRPHPLQDLATAPTPAVSSPFSSGSGNPFHQAPTAQHQTPGHHPAPAQGHAPVPSQGHPSAQGHAPAAAHPPAHGHSPAPAHHQGQAQVQMPPQANIPAQVQAKAPAQVQAPASPGQTTEPRFSGHQPEKGSGGGLRRGWRTRRPAPDQQSPGLTDDTGSFNGFTAAQPGPRTGIESTARNPLVPEPTAVSSPLPHPQPMGPPPVAPTPQNAKRGKNGAKEEDYADWLNGLGGQ